MHMFLKLLKFLLSRMVIVGVLIVLQLAILLLAIWKLGEYFVYLYIFFIALSFLAVLYILNKKDNPSYKLAWVIPILIFPVFGGLFYIVVGGNKASKRFRDECNEIFAQRRLVLVQEKEVYNEIREQDKAIAVQCKYMIDDAGYPIYKNTTTKYLSPGEVYFDVLVEALKAAEHFIFLEYFIIQEGKMWNTILDILVEKAKAGVDVRLLYDDAGTIQTVPYKYHEKLREMGLKVGVFNEIRANISLKKYNNRDHRKITVIDGHTGFTGGINLADEYINAIEKHGQWKDAGILIKGEAVASLTSMFLQAWEYVTHEKENLAHYAPHIYHAGPFQSDGYVQPYGDSPLDDETVGENVYLNMIHKACDYIYINTPYLIIDNELTVALSLAAKSGVDVRIVTPHVPDKWYVHLLTKAYYQQLIEAGVKIYEYGPGFIHTKSFVCDDKVAIVGSINLDYRSLYLHFECGAWLYQTQTVQEVKEDYIETLEVCIPITLEDCQQIKWYARFIQSILRVFSTLM